MAKQNDHGLIFEGDVKVRNLNQKGSGFIDIGNTTALTTQTSVETKERVSKQKGTYGSALDSLKTVKPTEIGLKLDTFDKDNLALALMGEAAVIAATAQTVTGETVTIGKKAWRTNWQTATSTRLPSKSKTSQTPMLMPSIWTLMPPWA